MESHCDTFGFEFPDGCRLTYKSKWQFWYPVFAILSEMAISGCHFCYFPSNHCCCIVRSQPYAHRGKQVQVIYAETLPRTLTSYRMAWMIIARRRRKANMETKMIRLANLSFSITYT